MKRTLRGRRDDQGSGNLETGAVAGHRHFKADEVPRGRVKRPDRRLAIRSQEDLAAELEISQSAISQLERPGDLKLSTLRKYLEKLGARLELIAVFDTDDERAVPIHIGETAS